MTFTFPCLRRSFCCALLSISFFSAFSQPELNYAQVATGFDFPVDIVNAGDNSNRLFIVEQGGVIKLRKGNVVSTFIDLSDLLININVAADERGLLSMAFHPDYNGTTNRYFFVYYASPSATSGSVTLIHVVRYQTMDNNPDVGDPASAADVITISKPAGRTNHNGGKLNFGNDGMLYFGTGDGGGSNDPDNLAQDGNSFMGKMFRIDINNPGPNTLYSIPPDNPFVGANDGVLDQIWALGLRNPFRWSFDPVTNAMWIGDVGEASREEVDVKFPSTGGVNYGWRCYEGNNNPPGGLPACNPLPLNYIPPIFEYTHDLATGGRSITGGLVYRGSGSPALYGYYVFSDFISGNVWVLDQNGTAIQQDNDLNGVTGFGVDEFNELYAVTRGSSAGQGSLYRITSPTNIPLPVTLVNFTGKTIDTYNELRWVTAYEANADKYIVEYSTDGINFLAAGEIAATNNATGSNYTFRHINAGTTKLFYRLQMRDRDGTFRYSSVITLGGNNIVSVRVYPTILNNNKLEITSNINLDQLKVFDVQGKQFSAVNLGGRQGYFSVQLPNLSKGIYFVKIEGKDYSNTERVVVQ